MPERKDSIDSFDEFFGASKPDDNTRKKSPTRPKQSETAISEIVKTQPVTQRPKTPPTPEERKIESSKQKSKVNNTKTTNGRRNSSAHMSSKTGSIHSKEDYESDFDDDDNGFNDDEETTIVSTNNRKQQHGSVPPPKTQTHFTQRRGSDSELKSSYTTTQNHKPTNGNSRRKETFLPYIKPQQTHRTGYPVRRFKANISSSAKNETEQRAASAKHNKIRDLENRLEELRRALEAQRLENATLRTIQRREEKAIKKYEEKEFDIHRIIRDYTHEIDHMKEVLTNERATKTKLEKQIEARDEKLRDQINRLKKYEKLVQEKNLEERYELHLKLTETDKKLEEFQDKLSQQEKYIKHLEKNRNHEVNQEIIKQRELKRQLEEHTQKYNDLLMKFEEKNRQIDTMHIYVQHNKRRSDSPTNMSKARSLQSLNETSPRDKVNDYEKKRRERQALKSKANPQKSSSNDVSSQNEKKKIPPKKEPENILTTTAKNSSNDEKSQNDHLPPKGKPPVRRLSTPKSIDEELNDTTNEDMFGSRPKKLPPPASSHAQIHKRPVAPEPPSNGSKNNSSGTRGNQSSSIFKLTEPPVPSKARTTRPLDDKWSEMFGTNEKEDAAKEDLLAKLVADEQQERKLAATQSSSTTVRPSMTMFESSTRSTTKTQPPPTTTTAKVSADPFESLFGNSSYKPTAKHNNDIDDIFSTKPSNQTTITNNKNDPFDSLFGPSSTNNNSSTLTSNSKTNPSLNDKLQRPKVVNNTTRPVANRAVVDEMEEFVL